MKMREKNYQVRFLRNAQVPALGVLGLILFFTLLSSAKAGTVVVGIGAFNNSQTIIDFGNVTQDTVLSNQWNNLSFSANWWGSTYAPNAYSQNLDGVSAANWRSTDGNGGNAGVSFASPPQLVGFDIWANFGNVSVDVTNGLGQLQTFQVYAARCDHGFGGPPPCESFAGFNDPSGISNIFLHDAPANNAWVLDNLRYQSLATNVPEPSTGLLLAIGLLGLLGNGWSLRNHGVRSHIPTLA